MIKVAIVGNIASGKSTVENILKTRNYKVLDTDKVCHSLLISNPKITETFRNYDVFQDNMLCRDKLGKLVFNNPDLKKKLEDLLYPELEIQIEDFFIKYSSEKLVFVAIPLLFEAGMENLFDRILFVYSDDEIRLNRLISRNGYSQEYAKLRLSSQLSQDDKINKSDWVIYNNSTLEDLKSAVIKQLEQIR